jgi:hypothetical protein
MRLITWIIALPAALIAAWIALANRAPVLFSLDPFSQDNPALAVRMPLYLLIFLSIMAGLLLGWFALGVRVAARRGTDMVQTVSGKAAALLPPRLRRTKTPSK